MVFIKTIQELSKTKFIYVNLKQKKQMILKNYKIFYCNKLYLVIMHYKKKRKGKILYSIALLLKYLSC